MRSMTGYGRGAAERDGWRVVAEIRSVNHRYTDLKLRGSSMDPSIEEKVATAVRSRVERGAITVTLRLDSDGGSAGIKVDLDAARQTYQELEQLAAELDYDQDVPFELLCAQPGVLVSVDVDPDTAALGACVAQAVGEALDRMIEMRDTEGAALARDLGARLDHLLELVDRLDGLTQNAPDEAKRRLEERLARLMSAAGVEVDANRLAQEVAILADRQDVTEELVRLRSHLDQARDVIGEQDEPVGRRLGFLVQEFGREFNTVASKSQSAEIASVVVDAKAELEKMREQVQNIE